MARFALTALSLLAVVMVSMVVYVLVSGGEPERVSADPEPPTLAGDFKNPPVLVFPERLRTFDTSFNRFIDRFIRATLEGRYSEFRQMWTRRLDPVSAEKYLRIWKIVREVRVLDIRPIRAPDGKSVEAFLIAAEVKQDPSAVSHSREEEMTRWIRAEREGNDWVFAPPEKNDRQRAFADAASQPSNGAPGLTSSGPGA